MKIDREKMMRSQMSQTTQNIFFSVRVKDYFAVLEEMTGNTGYRQSAQTVLQYSDLNDKYVFNFKSRRHKIREDITIGEMMYAANRMLLLKNYGGNVNNPDSFGCMIINTGVMLMEELLVKPIKDLESRRCKGLWKQNLRSDNEQAAV